jgi:hypothetical protein
MAGKANRRESVNLRGEIAIVVIGNADAVAECLQKQL